MARRIAPRRTALALRHAAHRGGRRVDRDGRELHPRRAAGVPDAVRRGPLRHDPDRAGLHRRRHQAVDQAPQGARRRQVRPRRAVAAVEDGPRLEDPAGRHARQRRDGRALREQVADAALALPEEGERGDGRRRVDGRADGPLSPPGAGRAAAQDLHPMVRRAPPRILPANFLTWLALARAGGTRGCSSGSCRSTTCART